jgi:hypothetical protein
LIYIYCKTPTDIFLFDNLGYHQANTLWRILTGWPDGITLPGKIEFIWKELAYPSNLLLVLALLIVMAGIIRNNSDGKWNLKQFAERDWFTCIMMAVLITIVSLTPRPLFSSYLAMPIPYVIIIITFGYSKLQSADKRPFAIFFLCVLLLTGVFDGVRLFRYLPRLPFTDKWTDSRVARIGNEIRNHIGADRTDDAHIATLAPLYALEACLPSYREFATGSFLYRVGDLLTDEQRRLYNGLSMSSLESFLDVKSPAAILVGYEGELDEPFIDYATKHDYTMVKLKSTDGILYIRPDSR